MRYEIELAQRARERLDAQPWVLQQAILHHLELLAESPTKLSRPSAFPYDPDFQMYSFRANNEGVIWQFTILFSYGADERTLYIHTIGYGPRGLTWNDPSTDGND